MKATFETSSAEARIAFGDEALYIEKYIPVARHIEVQILADQMGNVVHLGERDCSLQRCYQKVIEEAPAPQLSEDLRKKILQAGTSIARKIGYQSAGTVEFILNKATNQFYFLEMNTRIQVEHPVIPFLLFVLNRKSTGKGRCTQSGWNPCWSRIIPTPINLLKN